MAHQAGLGVFLLLPEWDANSPQGYPKHEVQWYPFIHLLEPARVKCLTNTKTQHCVPGQGLKARLLHPEESTPTMQPQCTPATVQYVFLLAGFLHA